MRRVLAVLITVIALTGGAWAEDPVHNEIRTLRDNCLQAVAEGNIDKAMPYLDKDVMLTTMNGEVCHGQDEVRAYFNKMLVGPNKIVASVKFNLQTDGLTTLYNGDTGVATGTSDDVYSLTNGSNFQVHTRWSATMVKKDNKWLLASYQMGANMFDNPMLDQAKHFMPILALGVGVAALVLGLVIGRVTARRSA